MKTLPWVTMLCMLACGCSQSDFATESERSVKVVAAVFHVEARTLDELGVQIMALFPGGHREEIDLFLQSLPNEIQGFSLSRSSHESILVARFFRNVKEGSMGLRVVFHFDDTGKLWRCSTSFELVGRGRYDPE
jgi:hypothetical protein